MFLGAKSLTDVNDELEDLQHGDVLLPPNANATGLTVSRVHLLRFLHLLHLCLLPVAP
jgi:hypothetical protein